MDFQQSFYFFGTLFMAFGLVILISLVIFLIGLEMRIKKFKQGIEAKIHSVCETKACGFMAKIAGHLINRFVSNAKKKKES